MITRNFELSPILMLYSVIIIIMLGLFIKKTHSFFAPKSITPTIAGVKRKFASASLDRPLSIERIKADKMTQAMNRIWDMKGLRGEVSRLHMRAVKKMEKVNERMIKATSSSSDEQKGEEQKDVDSMRLQEELDALNQRLSILKELETSLKSIESVEDKNFVALVPTLVELEISDAPPSRQEKVAVKKQKAPQPAPRKPYFTYKSADNIEIFVGRSASDNDELSCNAELRDEDDWWLHVVGYPGSHVVIRCTDDNIEENYPETVMDAAALAAANSKFEPKNRVEVSLTRVRNVKKPAGAKPGLVTIVGRMWNIKVVKINLHNEKSRMERLQKIG
jgi:predicted ribosome quality control (RQC) complex YloA/Tae2 family protein